jgi:hypothetical protein
MSVQFDESIYSGYQFLASPDDAVNKSGNRLIQ